ncbi:signal peptidase I [uncultured Bacteroides sp.]|uniref:signal peptidase I n=1 Tax=uncultured Bacteroides sp. TaxID=162156 RepID=UPI0025D4E990|nr:signal peptidase I [uncultured Bacteroides sp.]
MTQSLLVLFVLFQCYVLARLYLFASCVIPTCSMSPTLLGGDYIITSLQIPGRRIWEEDSCGHFSIRREEGIHKVRKGDVVVFNFPYSSDVDRMKLESKVFYCKRCVGVPGETYTWEWDAGKSRIYLPCAGEELPIDSTNYENYRKCIEYETGTRLVRSGRMVLLGDSVIHSYRFRNNYYFMCGDNYFDSYDSRFWGMLPEDFILGVGRFIWFSRDKESGKVRWSRMFKKI